MKSKFRFISKRLDSKLKNNIISDWWKWKCYGYIDGNSANYELIEVLNLYPELWEL